MPLNAHRLGKIIQPAWLDTMPSKGCFFHNTCIASLAWSSMVLYCSSRFDPHHIRSSWSSRTTTHGPPIGNFRGFLLHYKISRLPQKSVCTNFHSDIYVGIISYFYLPRNETSKFGQQFYKFKKRGFSRRIFVHFVFAFYTNQGVFSLFPQYILSRRPPYRHLDYTEGVVLPSLL